jgi:hypothetical protein
MTTRRKFAGGVESGDNNVEDANLTELAHGLCMKGAAASQRVRVS